MPWLGLVFNKYTLLAVIILGLLWAGNHYGPNARDLQAAKAATKVVNDEIVRQRVDDIRDGALQEARHAEAAKAFSAALKDQCILSHPTAQALNLIGD